MNKVFSRILIILIVYCTTGYANTPPFVIGYSSAVDSLDPYKNNIVPNKAAAFHVFESLTIRDSRFEIVPYLIDSYTHKETSQWHFTLKKNILFHDQTELTARDVIYSYERVISGESGSPFHVYTKHIKSIKLLSRYQFVINTGTPYPHLLEDLSEIPLIKYHDHPLTSEDFESGKAMIGTGLYRFIKRDTKGGIHYQINKKHHRYQSESKQPKRVVIRYIKDREKRLDQFKQGKIDLIEKLSATEAKSFDKTDQYNFYSVVSYRLIYLHMDSNRKVSPYVVDKKTQLPLPNNPLRNAKVRAALSLAINRNILCTTILGGACKPASQFVPELSPDHVPTLKVEQENITKAKQLLAEAGYPDGFGLTLHSTNDRYLRDAQVAKNIAVQLKSINIEAKAVSMSRKTFFKRASNLEFSFIQVGLGSQGNGRHMVDGLLSTYNKSSKNGSFNRGRYSNAQLDQHIFAADKSFNRLDYRRHLSAATEIGIKDYGIIPLYWETSIWGTQRRYSYWPTGDERTHADRVTILK